MPSRIEGGADVRQLKTFEEVATPHPKTGGIGSCPYHNALTAGDAGQLREVAAEMIRAQTFGDATLPKVEKVLTDALRADPADAEGKTNHALGVTYFLGQKWGDAIKHLEVAAQRDPKNADIQKVLGQARTNAATGIEKPSYVTHVPDAFELQRSPAAGLRAPEDWKDLPEKKQNAVIATLRNFAGAVGHRVAEAAISAADRFRDKDATFAFESWDRRGDLRGKLELAAMRHHLNEDPLQASNDTVLAAQHDAPKPAWTDKVRTATGAFTTDEPMEGAAGFEFQRTGAPVKARVNRAEDPSLPSAREVSRAILSADGPRKGVPFLNNLAIAWIQFETHDWVSHGDVSKTGAYEIPLAPDDPLRQRYGLSTMTIAKTGENPAGEAGKISYRNEVTHWWDGSNIYGSDQATQDRLRLGADGKQLPGGKLRFDGGELPLSAETGVEDTGFSRNWWVGLDVFHTLFVKNHNLIADKLAKAHPDWSSDQLFNISRMVNAAMMAKIHTVEWTPAVLPNKKLVGGMGANWWGLLETMKKTFGERKVDNGWEPRDPVLGGIVGGKRDNHGKPYGLSEEFVEVYRLHAGMMDHLDVLPIGATAPTQAISAEATRGTGARTVMEQVGMPTLLNSFGNQHMMALVNNNYPSFMQDMAVDGQSVMDLGAIDIIRARERGVPPYNEFRRQLGLNPISSFADLGADAKTIAKLESLYGKGKEGVEKMDLLAGTLSEAKRPENYGFGETLFQVFIQMASRRLEADPFYTDKFNAKYYSQEGMDMIEHATLKSLLLENFPELEKSGLKNVNNAFEPWGTDAKSHPEEHPLTAGSEKY
ncbi:MAG: hypothetical protein K1X89_12345 [Myxococcaceae bacterium]|nr:hypothetical protein [Myxococcaceae bacterium]